MVRQPDRASWATGAVVPRQRAYLVFNATPVLTTADADDHPGATLAAISAEETVFMGANTYHRQRALVQEPFAERPELWSAELLRLHAVVGRHLGTLFIDDVHLVPVTGD